jgi:photosystem II stability/assembly factor-like uncharacterized protein
MFLQLLAPLVAFPLLSCSAGLAAGVPQDPSVGAPADATAYSSTSASSSASGNADEMNPQLFSALEYRCIGPFRGGRSAAITGVASDPATYYFGAAGGGVWKTDDAGTTWDNISDDSFGGSIGAIAVSEWDENVIYVGGGEVTVRGNVSHGDGVWKSVDRGATWTHMGLPDSHHIPRIRIHPKNPDLVYAAVLGHLYGPSEERGVYRSKDGGQNWERILFANADAGAVDLVMDPSNPRIMYASTWRIRRTPFSLESGGDGCALWKSTDGGDTWKDISRAEGLPKGMLGIIGVTVSPVNPQRVFAIIENEKGGVFRSDDGGEKWTKVNSERKLRQRAWYYSRIYADSQDADVVYVMNVQFWKSKDGGKNFSNIGTPHGDHHDLWIAPDNNKRLAVADDGGGQVSLNGGSSWSTYMNQPTSQFYRVTTDDSFPYRVYGAQQDNSTVRIRHRTAGSGIGERDWEPTAGGESGFLAIDPHDEDVVFGGSYGGLLERFNHRTGERRMINVWPENPMGHGAEGMNPRFQWNFPILYSKHAFHTVYTAGNHLYKSDNDGHSWRKISPDLTHNNPEWLGASGGPLTKDNTGVEYFCTIFAVAESLFDGNVIWAGTDDGLIHITRDGGANWENISPPTEMMPELMQINCIEAHPTIAGGAYVAGTRYKSDDFKPYLYRTIDFGKTWKLISEDLPQDSFTRVIRADPRRPGLLYCGTETGVHVSFDNGDHWQSLQLNLPQVPITDLAWKNDDLVVATQGRSFWILDDVTPLHQITSAMGESDFWMYPPRPTVRMSGRRQENSKTRGQNPHNGLVFRYYLSEEAAEEDVRIDILEADGTLIRSFPEESKDAGADAKSKKEKSEQKNDESDNPELQGEKEDDKPKDAPDADVGMNQFVWNLRYPDAEKFDGLIMWAGSVRGPRAAPGDYQLRLSVGGQSQTVPFTIHRDPRSSSSDDDLIAQFDFLMQSRDKLSEAHEAVIKIRKIKKQLGSWKKRLAEMENADDESITTIRESISDLSKSLTKIEQRLYQTKNQSGQDPLNFPIRLNNKLAALASTVAQGDFRPTAQAVEVYQKLSQSIDQCVAELGEQLASEMPKINDAIRALGIPAIGGFDQ